MQNFGHLSHHGEPANIDAVAAIQLLELFRDPDHDVDRIVDFISQDPWLTAETLKRCNNSTYRGNARTTDIFEAVSRLGFYEVYDIISSSIGIHAMNELPSLSAPGPGDSGH